MKKVLLLPILAMAALASQSWADCNVGTNGTTSCCRWDNDPANCWGIGGTYDDSKTAADCTNNYGQVVSSCNADLKTPLGCCNWETEGSNCWTIFSGIDPLDGKDGASKVSECSGGSNRYWSGIACPTTPSGACPTSSPTYDGKNPADGFCCYEANSYNDYVGYCGPINASLTLAECQSNSGTQMSSCTGCQTSSPVISGSSSVASLTVLAQAGSLAISSVKEASVKLFDMRGNQVVSQKVSAGYSVVSFENQKRGVYYAVVTSGSSKQTVKVLLK